MYVSNMSGAATTAGATIDNKKMTLEHDSMDTSDFLNLLITELQNQDPMNPMDNTEFGSQVAQFSMLEKLDEIGNNISRLAGQLKNESTLQQAISLVNKDVQAKDEASDKLIEGKVEGIKIDEERVRLVIDGREYSISDIVRVQGK